MSVTLLKVIVLSRFLENDEIFKDLIQTVGLPLLVLLFVLEILKEKINNLFSHQP